MPALAQFSLFSLRTDGRWRARGVAEGFLLTWPGIKLELGT